MTLSETVIASLVFSLTAAASLRILDLASVSLREQERRQQHSDQLEAELVAFEAQLRSEVRQAAPLATCQLAAVQWLQVLQSSTPAPGLRRELTLVASGDALLLRLAADGLNQIRQRQYHPAAFGLCPPQNTQEVSHGLS